MYQNWITVAGLGLDLLGFVLLLREWWLAFFHETAMLEAERRQAWERSLRHNSTHASEQLRTHLDTSARIHDEMVERGAQSRHEATLRSRKRMFVAATLLIVSGSVLQILGALPVTLF